MFVFLHRRRKKIRLILENAYYRWRHGVDIDFEKFQFHDNKFSGRRLNILYLTYHDSTFSLNNTYHPLAEFGNVFKFELNPTDNRDSWYTRKVKLNQKMLAFAQAIAAERPLDVIVCYLSGYSTTPQTLVELRKLGIPMINESLDDERKFVSRRGEDGYRRGMSDICRYFDLSLTTSRSAIIKYLVEGGQPMYKPYAGNPVFYKKFGLEKSYDVVFVGANYGSRGEYIRFLEEHGIAVYAKGSRWERGFAAADEMIEIFNRAKIVLGFAAVGDNDDICILKGRDFEVPLTGSMYLTQYHPELEEYFRVGDDIATYRSKEELLEKVRYYLADDVARESIAQTGYQTCLERYTTRVSYEKVFGHIGL